jgi:O-antigen/teichoic acid export membrane protein
MVSTDPSPLSVSSESIDLPREAVRGSLWTYLSFSAGKVLYFVSTIVLARLLLPEQFGLMGYCLIALQYLALLNLIGVDALISRRSQIREAANAAFVANFACGALLFAAGWVLAPQIAKFFRAEAVTPLFRLLALTIPITALGSVPEALLQRDLRFRARLVPELGRSLTKGVLSVLLAWRGFGVASLVFGQIAGEVVATASVWYLVRWRPSKIFDRRVTREVLSYSFHIVALSLLGALFGNLDGVFVGRILGAQALGYYSLAYRIPDLVLSSTNMVVGRVAFPLLSRIQSNARMQQSTFFSYLRYMSLLIFPAGAGLAITASPLILIFYTSRWAPSIPAMQLIAVALAISSIGYVPGVLYKANNRPDILTKLALVKLWPAAAIYWYTARLGITAVAGGQIAVALINVILDNAVISRVLKFPLSRTLKALAPAAISSAVMALIGCGAAAGLVGYGMLGLFFLVLIGITAYLATLFVVSRDSIFEAASVLGRSRRPASIPVTVPRPPGTAAM